MYILPEKYLSAELAEKTSKNSIKNAYDRNNLSVIVRGSYWYLEACPDRIFNTVRREMKRLYPMYTYLYEYLYK